MTTIRVTCSHCDEDGVIGTPDIALLIVDGRFVVVFACPHPDCGKFNQQPAGDRKIGLLRSVGVPLPAAADDHLVARFAHQLETADIVAELERLGRT